MSDPTPSSKAAGAETPLHYQLLPAIAKNLREANPALTAAEWRLWSLLVTLDPFGDRYQDLPDLIEIMQECGISKPTFYRAIAKFEDLKLFDTQPLRVAFINLCGQRIVSKTRQQSQKRDNSLKNENSVSKMRQQSQKRDFSSPEPAHSKGSGDPQIYSYRSDLSHRERETLTGDPDFRAWLLNKGKSLPSPPTLLEQWLDSQAQLEANQREYLKHQERLQQASPLPPSAKQKDFDERESLIGLIHFKQQQGQILSAELQQHAAKLGINLQEPSTP